LGREGIAFTDALYLNDPDVTPIQLSQSGDVNPEVSILRYPRVAANPDWRPLFRPRSLDRVRVAVSSLEKSAALYRKLCGPEIRRESGQLDFRIGAGTLVVREAARGTQAGVRDFRVLVDRYDHAQAATRLKAVGVELRFEAAGNAPYFVDPDGIVVYLTEARV
jgi:catechol 2,3-dioxygenase-like lactoylglutathione lyase family enzyme